MFKGYLLPNNVQRRGSGGDEFSRVVSQLRFRERDGPGAMECASNASKRAYLGGSNEIDFEFERRTVLIWLERRGGRSARRIVQHGGDKAPAHMAQHLR